MALITREEHQRRQRRHRRQVLGLVVVCFVFLGFMHLIDLGVNAYKKATDKTAQMQEYGNLLRSVVMYDPMTFTGIDNAGSTLVQETSVWGTIYELIDKGNFDSLEKTEDERAILPGVDVSAFAAKLYGPKVSMKLESFTDDNGLEYVYDESLQGFLIPVTSMEDSYSPMVVQIQLKNGVRRVSVGYISNATSSLSNYLTESKPQKYADYIFERGSDRNWYFTGIQESEWKADEGDLIEEGTDIADLDNVADVLKEQIDQDETIETQPEG